jgi:hypothetical protein
MKAILLLIFLLISLINTLSAQAKLLIKTRCNYYTNEEMAQILIFSEAQIYNELKIEFAGKTLALEKLSGKSPYLISFSIQEIPIGKHELKCTITTEKSKVEKKVILQKWTPQFNEVKIDYYTQSLIVHNLPYIPFGFYNYWPVQPALAEEEVVKGFNMMSPYQKIEKETLHDRRNYMDRCAELGMKVNYNLCSLGGGGGVGSSRLKLSEHEIVDKLTHEVLEFKDHPALLSWYIADEPELNNVDPKLLLKTYNVIKELDPYHPVSIVFMHYEKAMKYYDAMDIVMADPYPIPQGSVTKARSVIQKLHKQFLYEKPIWMVPQAFGGNEWWPREPTKQEIRIMTYLAIFEQATGIQYFIRSGLNAFPKSTYTWAECGAIAHEIAELTPFLVQFDYTQELTVSQDGVLAKKWHRNGKEILIVVNTKNEPVQFTIEPDDKKITKKVQVLFENRQEEIKKGKLTSMISAFGTQVYALNSEEYNDVIHPKNIALDPSFEMNQSVGVPSNCYINPRGDKGATYFIDSRVAYHGEHSIRLTCPTEDNGSVLKFYRQRLLQNKTYTLSIWAKALSSYKIEEMEPRITGFWNRIRHFFQKLFRKTNIQREEKRNVLRLRIDDKDEEFPLSQEWQKFSVRTDMKDTKENTKIQNPFVQMTGVGVCWVDLMELIPDLDMEETLQMDRQQIEVRLISNHKRGKIYYRLVSGKSESNFVPYEKPVIVFKTALLQAKIVDNDEIIGEIQKDMFIHKAVGARIKYQHPYSAKYSGGGDKGLVNAKFAASHFQNRNWQGFIGNNLDVELDLRKEQTISNVKIGCLHDIHASIFLPEKITLYSSTDGINFSVFHTHENLLPMQNPDKFIQRFNMNFEPITSRYLKVVVQSIGKTPEWHKNANSGAWLFIDEIEVD